MGVLFLCYQKRSFLVPGTVATDHVEGGAYHLVEMTMKKAICWRYTDGFFQGR